MNTEKLVKNYTKQWELHLEAIDKLCKRKNKKGLEFPTPPSYMDEVLMPVIVRLAKLMPTYDVKIPDPNNYHPVKGFYRIKVGITMVGGFSQPDNGDFSLYFTPQKSSIPIGKTVKVESVTQLIKIIVNRLHY